MKHGRHVQVNNPYTIKPILRGHIEAKKKWPSKTGDLEKEVQFIRNFLRQNNERIFLNTRDCLIEVAAWAGWTVFFFQQKIIIL